MKHLSIMTMRTLRLLACLLLFGAAPAWCINLSLYLYPFTSYGNFNPSFVTPFAQSLTLDTSHFIDNCVCNDGFGVVFQSYPSSGSTDHNTALANDSYFSIALALQSGYIANLTSLSFDVGKGGSADPRGYFVRSSVDSYASDLSTVTLPSGAQAAPAFASINLTGSQFQGLSAITFRFYVWTPDPSNNSVDWNDITLNGSAAALPEPGSLGLLAAGIGLLAVRRRRRR